MSGLAAMKEELHQRLWSAQARWFALGETGKHDLKMEGLTAMKDWPVCGSRPDILVRG